MSDDIYPEGPWDQDEYYEDDLDGGWEDLMDDKLDLIEEYHKRYVTENVPCPVCGKTLTQYRIPTDRLFVWPGAWPDDPNPYYPPWIALDIFAVYDVSKGIVHEPKEDGEHVIHHIWVGTGEYQSEKLIQLNKRMEPDGS